MQTYPSEKLIDQRDARQDCKDKNESSSQGHQKMSRQHWGYMVYSYRNEIGTAVLLEGNFTLQDNFDLKV